MSVSCQYDQLRYPFYAGDVSRNISIETKLNIPPHLPGAELIIDGDFQIGPPLFSLVDDYIIISGKVYPHCIYLAESMEPEPHRRHEHDEEDAAERRDEEDNVLREYGVGWYGEDGINFEEKLEIPGLRPEMVVQVELTPGKAEFKKVGADTVVFLGEIEVIAHTAYHQVAGVIREIEVQTPDKLNITKERPFVEELMGTRKATLPIQSNLVLPSLKPGVSRILKTLVKPVNISQEIGRGRLYIRGVLDVSIVYAGCDDEGNTTEIFAHDWNRELGTAVPFEVHLDLEDTDDEILAVPRITARDILIEPRIPHELRCMLDLDLEIGLSKITQKELIVEAAPVEGALIDSQQYLLNLEEYSGAVAGEIELEQKIELVPGADGMERILVYQGIPRDLTVEAADGKVLLEGNLDLWLMYIGEDGRGQRVQATSWRSSDNNGLPLTGTVDFPGLQPGTLLRTQVALETLQIDMVDSRSLKLKGTVKLRVFARTPRALFVLKDLALITPVDPSSRPSMLFYVVQPGDTLWKIARRYETTVNTLVKTNQITNPDLLDVGQKLLIAKQIVNG